MRKLKLDEIYDPVELVFEDGSTSLILHPVLYLDREDITRAGFDGENIEEGQVHDIADSINNTLYASGDFLTYVEATCADLLED